MRAMHALLLYISSIVFSINFINTLSLLINITYKRYNKKHLQTMGGTLYRIHRIFIYTIGLIILSCSKSGSATPLVHKITPVTPLLAWKTTIPCLRAT